MRFGRRSSFFCSVRVSFVFFFVFSRLAFVRAASPTALASAPRARRQNARTAEAEARTVGETAAPAEAKRENTKKRRKKQPKHETNRKTTTDDRNANEKKAEKRKRNKSMISYEVVRGGARKQQKINPIWFFKSGRTPWKNAKNSMKIAGVVPDFKFF